MQYVKTNRGYYASKNQEKNTKNQSGKYWKAPSKKTLSSSESIGKNQKDRSPVQAHMQISYETY